HLPYERIEFSRGRNVNNVAHSKNVADTASVFRLVSPLHALGWQLCRLTLSLDASVRHAAWLQADDGLVLRRLQHNPEVPRIDIRQSLHFGELFAPVPVRDFDMRHGAAPAAMLAVESHEPCPE